MFLLAVVLPLRSFQSARNGELKKLTFDTRAKKMMYYGNGAFLWVLCLAVMILWILSGRPLAQLGFGWGQLPYSSVAWLTIGVFTVLYLVDLYSEIGSPRAREDSRQHFQENIAFLPANGLEFTHYLFLAFTAGFCEEVVFRGYFIRYFAWLFGQESQIDIALVLCLPALIFGLSHFYQGWKAVVKIVAMAVMFGVFFLLTGTIWPLVFLHALVDVLGGVISWYLLDENAS